MTAIALALTSLLLLFPAIVSATVVTGTISDEEGRPLTPAHLYLPGPDDPSSRRLMIVEVDRFGRFIADIRSPGYHVLNFAAPGRVEADIELYVPTDDRGDTVLLDVRLALPEWYNRVTRLYFEGEWNRYHPNRDRRTYADPVPGAVHTEELVADGDTLFYWVVGTEPTGQHRSVYEHRLPASDYDGLQYDRSEGYRYWVRTRPGEPVRLRLDMGRIWPVRDTSTPSGTSTVAVDERSRWIERLVGISGMLDRMYSRYHRIMSAAHSRFSDQQAWYASGIGQKVWDTVTPSARDTLLEIIRTDGDRRIREVAAAHLMTLLPYDTSRAEPFVSLVRDLLPATSSALALAPQDIVHYASALSGGDPDRYLQSVVDSNPVPGVRLQTLFDLMDREHERGNIPAAVKLYHRLTDEFGGDEDLQFTLSEGRPLFDPVLGNDEPFPPFDLPALDGRSRIRYTPRKGIHTLVDIWSPENPRCLGELAVLREADSVYRARGLEVVSIAVGGKEPAIRRVLDSIGATWKRAIVPAGRRAEFLRRYRAFDLPRRFLVDPDGRIAAVEFNTSRWMLMKTLSWTVGLGDEE